MATLLELKDYLRKLDYPNLNILSDEEIAELFGAENRKILLTWFIRKLDPSITLPQEPQDSVNIMADVIREHGFCTSSEKHVFVQGDSSLNVLKQLEIIKRMLSYLGEGQEDKENLDASCNIMSVEDVADFTKMNINLFPAYGPMRTRKQEDRLKKIEYIEKQIAQVKKEIEENQSEESKNTDIDTNRELKDVDLINALEEATVAFHNLVEFLVEHDDKKDGDFQLGFSDGFDETVAKCDAEIHTVANVVQSLSTITNVSQDISANTIDEPDENLDLITPLAILSNKVKMENNTNTFS